MKELSNRMQYEPSVLFVGKNYQSLRRKVYDYQWNMLITTNITLDLAACLKNETRMVQDVFERSDMQANMLNQKNLHVIRLCGDETVDSADDLAVEDAVDNATVLLTRVAEIISRSGVVIIEDFIDDIVSYQIIRKAFKSLFTNQEQLHIFNYNRDDRYVDDLVKQGIAVTYKESFNDYFEENIFDEEDEYLVADEKSVHIYLNSENKGKVVEFEKRNLLETESFATLLNVELMTNVRIPHGMKKDYFYTFLKNSVREPQWYGYEYGFNLHRSFEDRLYRKAKKGLENVGKPGNKPLVVTGQTGTGKTIAVTALAYKIFNEKKYPVVFINNPDINFYSSVEYKQKEISRKGSSEFNALDMLLEQLEDQGAKATLIIWDTSSYSSGKDKCYRLYQALLARGRKIYMVSTAYEDNPLPLIDSEESDVETNVYGSKFIPCKAEVSVEDEVNQLKKILIDKCEMRPEQVENIINIYAQQSSNFLALFYQVFDMLRGDLSRGVYREASMNLQDLEKIISTEYKIEDAGNIFALAFQKAEKELLASGLEVQIKSAKDATGERVEVAKEDFIKCLAVCSYLKCKMPYDFALRILGTYNADIIRSLSKSTFFSITKDYYNNLEISIRTPLEAGMYLNARNMSPVEQVDCIVTMLNNMKSVGEYGQQQEVRLCEKLIRVIGPNNRMYGKTYRNGYEVIINALKKLRLERNIWEPILISQEITFIREYYGMHPDLEKADKIKWLKEAVTIADEILAKSEYFGMSAGTRNAIIVESANSKLLLCELNSTNDALLYKELRRDLREVIKYDNQDYHAYVTLLKGSITEYKNENDEVKKLEMLEAMCAIADEIKTENTDVADSPYFQSQVAIIYSYLTDSNIVQKYVDELAANGSAAGVYILARKQLMDSGVEYRTKIINEIQLDACRYAYELLTGEKYKYIVADNEPCQYMLLNMVWLIHNREPMYQVGECWKTRMNETVWNELLMLCNSYIMKFSGDSFNAYKVNKNVKYILALCQAQLGQYVDCIATLRTIEEDSSTGLWRVITKHMICDSTGTPKKFTGRLGKYDEIKRTGTVYIEEFGRNPLYYFGPHLNSSKLDEGEVFNDLEVGLSNISPKVYRSVGNEVKINERKGD